MNKTNFPTFQIGTLVRVNAAFLGEPKGVIAYVYDTYTGGGISLITQNGVDLGGFSSEEQDLFLEYWRDTGLVYRFSNVIKLARDWEDGFFEKIFKDISPDTEVKQRKGI